MGDYQDVGTSFDARAERYNLNEWHQACAERLVAFSRLRRGDVVLDAGTGTGWAAIAAARVVGASGRIIAVDLSGGMLAVARRHVPEAASAPIEWVQGNAIDLTALSPASLDSVVCGAALLYMPVPAALAEWRRILRPGGTVAVSSMRAGSPVAGRVFRDCAAAHGFRVADPSEALGSEAACHAALQQAGIMDTVVASDRLPFTAQDAAMAWESNLGSAAHEVVREAGPEALARMKEAFVRSLAEEERRVPGSTSGADVLFARGSR